MFRRFQKKSKVVASKSAEIIRAVAVLGRLIGFVKQTGTKQLKGFRDALWPFHIKASWVKVSSIPYHPLLLGHFCSYLIMAPLRRESVIFLQSRLTEELTSDVFWTESTVASAFHEDTLRLFGDIATILNYPLTFPTDCLLPSFEGDNLGQPCSRSGEESRSPTDVAVNALGVPLDFQSEYLYDILPSSTHLSITLADCSRLDLKWACS